MADDKNDKSKAETRDQVALELMKFIAEVTGYGKGGPAAGFSGKPSKSPEEYAEALLQLYERYRTVVTKAGYTG